MAFHRFRLEARKGASSGRKPTSRDFMPVLYPLTKIVYALIVFVFLRWSALAEKGVIAIPEVIALFSLGVTAIVHGWIVSRLLPGLMAIPSTDRRRKSVRFSFVRIVCCLFEAMAILPVLFSVIMLMSVA